MNDVQYPLRERRKRRTRAALVDAGRELFGRNGFAATTMEQIAEQADVHVQTLYRHFPSKEALALAPERERFEGFRRQVEDPLRTAGTLTLWRAWVEAWATEVSVERREGFLARARDRERTPSLAVAQLRLWHDYEDLLTAMLARDMNLDPDHDRLPRLVACMLWGGNHAALRQWVAQDGRGNLVREVLSVIDDIAERFDGLLGAAALASDGDGGASARAAGA